MDEGGRTDDGSKIAVVRNDGCGDLNLPRDIVQREETAKGGLEVLARVRSKDKDLIRWVEVGDVMSSDVVPEPCETTMVTSVGSQDVTEGGSATRSREPG